MTVVMATVRLCRRRVRSREQDKRQQHNALHSQLPQH
jgi:hypothetical protein